MQTIVSKDGTKIAYDKRGQGPALILMSGAFSTVPSIRVQHILLNCSRRILLRTITIAEAVETVLIRFRMLKIEKLKI